MENYQQLVDKELTGNISEVEKATLETWRKKSATNERAYRRLHNVWHNAQPSISIKGQKASWEKLSHRIDFSDHPLIEEYKKDPFRFRSLFKYAAAIALAISTFYIIAYFNASPETTVATSQNEWVIKNNPAGQKSGINLPDGSVCWLNSESEIRYLSNFTDSARDIYLVGEAYFEVAKDKSKPFKVSTASMEVVALGTVFNISSFPEDLAETVALVEGKIAVEYKGEHVEVMPGESVKFDKTRETLEKATIDVQETIAWKNGTLQFNEETYETIFSKLERWYGVNITISGDMPSRLRYKSKFKDESLENVLESIRYGHDFQYELNGKDVEIMF
ncbi:MAG: FecR family protein [Cyclobacteriaceae bacterium]|nr:FecR family protein [Cyclobacteriaceae bacterium]